MSIIRPISDLRNSFSAISELCHTLDEPIYITKNGKEDLVIMSTEYFDKISNENKVAESSTAYNATLTLDNVTTEELKKELALRKLCKMLEESEDEFKNHPERCLTHEQVFEEVKRRIVDEK